VNAAILEGTHTGLTVKQLVNVKPSFDKESILGV